MDEPLYLPRPAAALVAHAATVIEVAGFRLKQGIDTDPAQAVAAAIALVIDDNLVLQEVLAFLAGDLDSVYGTEPGGRDAWTALVAAVAGLPIGAASPAPTPIAVRPGALFASDDAPVPVAHPVHTLGAVPITDANHPNVIRFAANQATARRVVEAAARSRGLWASSTSEAVIIAPSRRSSFRAAERTMVRFFPLTFADPVGSAGTGIVLCGIDVGQILRIRQALLER